MLEMGEFGLEPGFVPPKNLQYFLLILNQLKVVKGRTKLFKIHSLIEEEGHVKYNLPIDTYPLGPVDYETFNFCKGNDLIGERLVSSSPYDYYEMSLTRRGGLFFRGFCEPNMKEGEVRKALRVILKYKKMGNREILARVHKKYVDPYKESRVVKRFIAESVGRSVVISSIIKKRNSNDDSENLLAEIRHMMEILKSLLNVRDATKIGTVLVNLNSLFGYLEVNGYNRNAMSIELFEFLDNYADKEGIQKSITSDDFSDIPMEERERLFDAIVEMKIPKIVSSGEEINACTSA